MLHHESPDQKVWGLVVAVQDSNRAAAHSAVSKATVRLCLARGSQRLGMSTKKDADHSVWDFFRGGGTGLEQQRRRPPPAAETGSRGWGRVLIFQSPAKGLRKNQQTQPVQAPAVRFRQGSQRVGMSTKRDAARPFGLGIFCLWWVLHRL